MIFIEQKTKQKKDIEKNLLILEKSLSKLKTHHEYDNIEEEQEIKKLYLIYQLMKIIRNQQKLMMVLITIILNMKLRR